MDQLKAHAPIIGFGVLAVALFVSENRGILRADQVQWILAFFGLATGKAQLHIDAPNKVQS